MEDQVREIDAVLERLNALLPSSYHLAWVALGSLRRAKRNARVMSPAMFSRLRDNIARDGALGSLPLCWKNGDKYEIISGHHRVEAAIAAGVERALVLYVDGDVSEQDRIAMQLSHNTLSGSDDLQILLQMTSELTDPKLYQYAATDLVDLPKTDAVTLPAMSEAHLRLRPVLFYLTDATAQTLEQFVEMYNERPIDEDEVGYVVASPIWEAFLEKLSEIAAKYKLASASGALNHAISLMGADLKARAEDEAPSA